MSVESLVAATQPPCNTACPAGVNVQAYVGLIAQGRYQEALDVVRENLPFPAVCGRVCPAFCEAACQREELGGAVSIRALKRFISEAEEKETRFVWDVPPATHAEKVAVIGGGPAGLTAALDLRRAGYPVTVFEARDELGGMLTSCLPTFRLPRDVVHSEIESITSADIQVRTGVRVGKDVTIPGLLEEHAAVVVTVGAHVPQSIGIPGWDSEGVIDAIEYLAPGFSAPAARRAVILGGGSTAVDAARAAVRKGYREVRILYRRTREEMPAGRDEVEQAIDEGVILQTQIAPLEVVASQGKVTGIRCQRTRQGEPDESGRRRPEIIPGSEFTVETDCIISAIGQQTDPTVYEGADALGGAKGRMVVDTQTLQGTDPRVFGAGDAVTGPATIIEAVAQGHRAAYSVLQYLRAGKASPLPASEDFVGVPQTERGYTPPLPRVHPPLIGLDHRGPDTEVELVIDEEAARAEAERCLRCGACGACVRCDSGCGWRLATLEMEAKPRQLIRVARTLFPEDVAGAQVMLDGLGEATSLACSVVTELCRSCGTCVEACAFEAATRPGNGTATIDPALCRGCGICVAECPSGAIQAYPMDDTVLSTIMRQIQPGQSVLFRCEWCGGPTSGYSMIVRVPCAGRVSAGLVATALARGASRVDVAGCADHDCRYGGGAPGIRQRLSWMLELDPQRIQVT